MTDPEIPPMPESIPGEPTRPDDEPDSIEYDEPEAQPVAQPEPEPGQIDPFA